MATHLTTIQSFDGAEKNDLQVILTLVTIAAPSHNHMIKIWTFGSWHAFTKIAPSQGHHLQRSASDKQSQ